MAEDHRIQNKGIQNQTCQNDIQIRQVRNKIDKNAVKQ